MNIKTAFVRCGNRKYLKEYTENTKIHLSTSFFFICSTPHSYKTTCYQIYIHSLEEVISFFFFAMPPFFFSYSQFFTDSNRVFIKILCIIVYLHYIPAK